MKHTRAPNRYAFKPQLSNVNVDKKVSEQYVI